MVSFCALAISLQSYLQRKSENRFSLRKHLTEVLEKITDLNTDVAKYRSLQNKEGYPQNYVAIVNDQRRFFARQAAHLADQIRDMTSPYEYLVIAGALSEVEAVDQAETYFKKALEMENTPMETARISRAYGRFLFQEGRPEEGRDKFWDADTSVQGTSDVELAFRGNTYERLAIAEEEYAPDRSEALLERAVDIYKQFHHPLRRDREVERVRGLLRRRRNEPE